MYEIYSNFFRINKHLKGRPYNVNFDIVTDERFRVSNDCLEKQLKLLKGIGRTITHKQPISITDLRRMYDSGVLGTSNPLSLLRKVWFEITLHFCHKGSESQEKLLKNSFEIYRDITGRAYVARNRTKEMNGQPVHQPPITPYETLKDAKCSIDISIFCDMFSTFLMMTSECMKQVGTCAQ